MKESVTLSPPNSLILVMDHLHGKLPEDLNGQLVAHTDSCVVIGTLSGTDGPTTITVLDGLEDRPKDKMVFDGVLRTPHRELSVCSVDNEKLLTIRLGVPKIHIQIFANDAIEPDEITIFICLD
jgi:hypothetical protein